MEFRETIEQTLLKKVIDPHVSKKILENYSLHVENVTIEYEQERRELGLAVSVHENPKIKITLEITGFKV